MKQIRRTASMLALLVLATTAASASVIPIADARAEPAGTEVTVEGSVTVPSGDFASSTFDQGFAIEDETAGIYVSIATNLGLNFHRRVRVTGVVDDDGFGQLILKPADADAVEIPGGASRVDPEPVATGDVGEATEGSLVEVTGTVTEGPNDDLPFGYSVFIDDGSGETQVFIPATTGINPFNIPYIEPGARIRVIGLSSQFLSQLEVLPRIRGDIHKAK